MKDWKKEAPIKDHQEPTRHKESLDGLLAQSLKAVLAKQKNQIKFELKQTEASKLWGSTISSPHFCGYLVCTSPGGHFQKQIMEETISLLRHEMLSHGEELSKDLELVAIESQKKEFLDHMMELADFVLTSQGNTMVAAYFSSPSLPQVIEADDESMLGISLRKDLVPNTEITFDIYLQFAENQKFLRYLPAHQIFTQEMFDKFKKFEVLLMFIKKSDREAFFSYCAKNTIDR